MKDKESIAPPQEIGLKKDIVESVTCRDEPAARALFQLARQRLFQVNGWGEISKGLSSQFALYDSEGKPVQRAAKEGDYFRIDLPGPGSVAGDGYDWVRVVAIEDEKEHAFIRVQPASSPLNKVPDTAHFLDPKASSTFSVRQEGRLIRAEIFGRNEVANTEASSPLDKIRNAVISLGAWAGFSDLQWHNLAAALVRTDEAGLD